jgi:hypothetical protein
MDIQQKINLALFEAFTQRGIEFAYPTNVTYIQSAQAEDQPLKIKTLSQGG